MRIGRWVLRGLATGPILVLAYVCAAALGAVVPGARGDVPAGGPDVTVRLLAGPIHYDLLLPATKETRRVFGFAAEADVPVAHPAVEWIVVGWGARAFYTTTGSYRDVEIGAVLRGVFGDGAVLRVDVAGALPDDVGGRVLTLSHGRYRALLGAILAARAPGRALDHPGFTETDAFFPALGRFHLFRTCNVWVGEVLRAAGLRFGAWTPMPYSVTLSHRVFGNPGSGRS